MILQFLVLIISISRVAGSKGGKQDSATPKTVLNDAPFRFDYRQTFKKPYLTTEASIPYFNVTGDAIHGRDSLRLVPSIPFRSGAIWCTTKNTHKHWATHLSFAVHSPGNTGGDGFVFWYIKPHPVMAEGRVSPSDAFYGHTANFEGIAVVFDTSDTKQNRYNPFVYAIRNDGTKTRTDFVEYQSTKVHLGGCYREYRNTPHPVHAIVSYVNKTLSLDIDIRQYGKSFTNCFKATVDGLPTDYVFGVSAATDKSGADDHDLFSFETYEIYPFKKEHKTRPFEDADIKKGREFKMDDKVKKV